MRAAGVTPAADVRRRGVTVIWVDSREARLIHVEPAEPARTPLVRVERLESDVPVHHHTTGHVRIHPPGRHGGGGAVEDRIEDARNEHLRAFVEDVAAKVDPDWDVEVVGPGTVRLRLARELRSADRRHGRTRIVSTRAAAPRSDPQLVARALELTGRSPRRRHPACQVARSNPGG